VRGGVSPMVKGGNYVAPRGIRGRK